MYVFAFLNQVQPSISSTHTVVRFAIKCQFPRVPVLRDLGCQWSAPLCKQHALIITITIYHAAAIICDGATSGTWEQFTMGDYLRWTVAHMFRLNTRQI